jgi:hypothetical protein
MTAKGNFCVTVSLLAFAGLILAADSPLRCFTQYYLPDGNLPEMIQPQDWTSSADISQCKDGTKWSLSLILLKWDLVLSIVFSTSVPFTVSTVLTTIAPGAFSIL